MNAHKPTPEQIKVLHTYQNMIWLYLEGQRKHGYPEVDFSWSHDDKTTRRYYRNVNRRLAAKFMVKYYLFVRENFNVHV